MTAAVERRPLVLLDIDGVIHDREAMREIRLSHDPEATATRLDVNVVVSYGHRLAFPSYMPVLIQRLNDAAEIWWCTTWRHRANDDIREHLGIEDLAVIDDGTRAVGLEWKVAAATPLIEDALAAGRAVYWIEDFRGTFPEIGGVTCIDTTDAGILRHEDILPTLR